MAKTIIDALLREREGYEFRQAKDRIKQVDDQLDALDYKGPRDSAKWRAAQVKASSKPKVSKETAVAAAPENTVGE